MDAYPLRTDGLHSPSADGPPPWLREGGSVLDWVARACERFPDRTAVEWRERRLTYADLSARADAVAGLLRPGDVAAVFVADRIEMIAAMLGVVRAGCVFVPFAMDAPPERVRRQLERLAPEALIVGAAHREQVLALCDTPRAVLTMADGRAPEAEARPGRAGGMRPMPPETAYVYYTSGSTGEPRGVMGTLAGISHFIEWEARTFGVGPGWRMSQLIVPTFDPYFRDALLPLCTGGTVCIPPAPPSALHPDALTSWIDGQGINLVHSVPSLFALMLEADLARHPCRALRCVFLAGETLQTAHVRRWRAVFGDRVRLVNLYGSTETTMVKLFHVVGEQDVERGFIPAGRPIDGAEVLLLDEHGAPCPAGAPGEVHVRSRYVTLGYYGDPEATRRTFPGGGGDVRVCRTGDLAVQLGDGSYRLIGRADDQIKVRGVRVEPGEVTAVLSECPLVRSCVAVPRRAPGREAVLAAYVVPAAGRSVDESELRDWLLQRLPAEMVPSAFVFLDRLPLNARGKVDRAALPAPGRPELLGRPVPPRTPTEAALAALWCDVLGLDEVGVHDDFLHLGGHSLAALRLTERVRNRFGIEMPVRVVFDSPTVERMAAYVAQETARTGGIG